MWGGRPCPQRGPMDRARVALETPGPIPPHPLVCISHEADIVTASIWVTAGSLLLPAVAPAPPSPLDRERPTRKSNIRFAQAEGHRAAMRTTLGEHTRLRAGSR